MQAGLLCKSGSGCRRYLLISLALFASHSCILGRLEFDVHRVFVCANTDVICIKATHGWAEQQRFLCVTGLTNTCRTKCILYLYCVTPKGVGTISVGRMHLYYLCFIIIKPCWWFIHSVCLCDGYDNGQAHVLLEEECANFPCQLFFPPERSHQMPSFSGDGNKRMFPRQTSSKLFMHLHFSIWEFSSDLGENGPPLPGAMARRIIDGAPRRQGRE